MLNEDLAQRYPRILRNEVSVHIVQSRSHILNTYDEALSRYAEEKFARNQIDVLTDARVSRIEKDKVIFTQNDPSTHMILTKELPYGLCLWSTGVAQTEFAQRIANKIEVQKNSHALETDPHLRLLGTPLGDVYCIGDCSTVQNNITAHITEFVRHIAWENGIKDERNINLTFSQWRSVVPRIKRRFPQTCDHLRRLDKLFEEYDQDRSGTLDFDELKKLLEQIDAKLTSLPATAQRAHQQGEYLAKKFNLLARAAPGLELNQIQNGYLDEAVYKAFEYKHLGSLAYIGNAAVFDWGHGISAGGGIIFLYIWRSVYFAQSVSMRTRMLMAMDWTKRALFGRGMEKLSSHPWGVLMRDGYANTGYCRFDELLDTTMGVIGETERNWKQWGYG
jgi:NADH dehydrogenase